MDRRGYLRLAGSLGIVGLAGCGGDGANDSPTASVSPEPTERTATESPTQSETATPTETATEASMGDSTSTDTETPTATATASPTEPSTATVSPTQSPTPSPTATATPVENPDQIVEVGPDGDFRFDPESFEIEAGDTVQWTWDSGGHNVRPDANPDDDWTGTDGGDDTTYSNGHTYHYTFEVTGDYTYYCAPHRSLGMTGSFTVVESS